SPSLIAGSATSSLHPLKDHKNQKGGYFIFADLSIKRVGLVQLEFCLYQLKPLGMSSCVEFLTRVTCRPFRVVAQKDFAGMAESTFLSRSFQEQGVRMRLRKEAR
ncbi:hypothetical protein P280DRAFT_358785, partial [Massarina eburnea CBS 473.64]